MSLNLYVFLSICHTACLYLCGSKYTAYFGPVGVIYTVGRQVSVPSIEHTSHVAGAADYIEWDIKT